MKCSITLDKHHNTGNYNMKTLIHNKSNFQKDPDFDTIVDQLCMKLQDIKDQEECGKVDMKNNFLGHNDAVQKYYAAFPALKKGEPTPTHYFMPPPSWCGRTQDNYQVNMQHDLSLSKELNRKKFATGKERRNSYHGQRKNSKRKCHSFSRSFESKDNLPEWMTHEGVWDMESQDPVKEFIRAIALDEGYGTCENTVTDDLVGLKMKTSLMSRWDDNLDIDSHWVIKGDLDPPVTATSPTEDELYAKFKAKFNSSIEALWSKEQANTPDDEYQDLPIDFQDLLSSPSDRQFYEQAPEKPLYHNIESIWSNDAFQCNVGGWPVRAESPSRSVDALHDRFKPLNLMDEPVFPDDPYCLYSYEDIYEAVPSVSDVMRSLTALNHSRNRSSFTEVLPRPRRSVRDPPPPPAPPRYVPPMPPSCEDLLTSAETHFRPIRRETDTESSLAPRYADGATFDICGDPDPAEFLRSPSGFLHLRGEAETRRYLEWRRRDAGGGGAHFRLRFAVRLTEMGVQTEPPETDREEPETIVPCPPESEAATRAWRVDRKRRHSAALRCGGPRATCPHPHAPFLHCCTACSLDRPLTR